MASHEGTPVSELVLADQARRVQVPYGGGSEYVCPNCERAIPTRKQIRLAKPAKHEHVLNDVLRCPFCQFIFSPRSEATVLRG